MASYLQSSHQYMLNEQGSGMYSLQFSSVPNPGTTTFDGMGPAYSIVETVTVDANGMAIGSGTTTFYFLLNPYVPLGEVSSLATPYGVVTSTNPFPATLNVGDSGTLDTATLFHDATMTVVDATLTVSYMVTANDSSTLLLCLNATTSAVTAQGTTDGLANGSESNCYTVDAAGNVTLESISLTVSGTPLKFVVG
ncbi:MAG TPA: hypothetical protein DEP35_16035 [Deltaproteobacteria bacterium]|nr:hypothetical protein [Deltaproteobacteria bacterium]